jgi:hypothetical protein
LLKIKAEENFNVNKDKNNHPKIKLGHSSDMLNFNNEK